MRRSLATAVALLIAVLASLGSNRAFGQGTHGGRDVPGSQQIERHDPNSPNYADYSRGYAQHQLLHSPAQTTAIVVRPAPRPISTPIVVAPIYGFYYSGWPYGYYSSYPYFLDTDSGTLGPYVAPPVVTSGDSQFGPQAVQRFMGVNPVPRPAAPPVVAHAKPLADAEPAAPPPSDSKARVKAWRLIDSGDDEFFQRRFAQALGHYRQAAAAARDLADAQFRQAFAQIAIGRYSEAVKAIERGLQLNPDWADSDFTLDDLYGDNKELKKSHLDALKNAVAAHPHDAELLFLLGVFLYFDGQKTASAPFFHRAEAVLGGAEDDPLVGFLKNLPPDKPAGAAAAPEPKIPAPGERPPAQKPADGAGAKVPPPPLPNVDRPGDRKPGEMPAKPAERSRDPFEGLDNP